MGIITSYLLVEVFPIFFVIDTAFIETVTESKVAE